MSLNRLATSCLRLGNASALFTESKLLKVGLKTSAPIKAKGPIAPGYKKIRVKMEKFQVDDGVPIHLKGGAFDMLLYCTTLAACAAGLLGSFHYIYHSAFPKKAKEC